MFGGLRPYQLTPINRGCVNTIVFLAKNEDDTWIDKTSKRLFLTCKTKPWDNDPDDSDAVFKVEGTIPDPTHEPGRVVFTLSEEQCYLDPEQLYFVDIVETDNAAMSVQSYTLGGGGIVDSFSPEVFLSIGVPYFNITSAVSKIQFDYTYSTNNMQIKIITSAEEIEAANGVLTARIVSIASNLGCNGLAKFIVSGGAPTQDMSDHVDINSTMSDNANRLFIGNFSITAGPNNEQAGGDDE